MTSQTSDIVTKRRKRDPNTPKRMISSYMFFSIEKSPLIKRDNPGLNIHELATHLAELWHQLTKSEKQPYFKKYEVERERYYLEKAAYDAKKNGESHEMKEIIPDETT